MNCRVCTIVALTFTASASAQEAEKPPPKKVPPALVELLKAAPADFIERFDKNGDGLLGKDELPPGLAKGFEKVDRNSSGTLDREEVAAMLTVLRKVMGAPPAPGKTAEEVADNLLKQLDTDRDGKIARGEAKGPLGQAFDKVDRNGDGQLDRKELLPVAERLLATRKEGGPAGKGGRPDFDALDKDADGRLSRDELKGTPWLGRFAEIDADRGGSIDRREFETFLTKDTKKADFK